jgi:hypothetical protein
MSQDERPSSTADPRFSITRRLFRFILSLPQAKAEHVHAAFRQAVDEKDQQYVRLGDFRLSARGSLEEY